MTPQRRSNVTAHTSANPLPIAVLISGGGTTLRNLLLKIDQQDLPIEVRLVVSSNPSAGGLAYAEQANIPVQIAECSSAARPDEFSAAVFDPCRQAGAELVVMGGFLKHVLIPEDFENRVVNIHPGLIPAFCGHGFYGRRVHQAVLDYGAKVSGCTIHFVDDEYDHGPIILQRSVPVEHDDTAERLAKRIFRVECEAYPEALRLIAEGRVQVTGRRVEVLQDET
jgi:phosphoribosylglycinamide formyltransferase-1